MNSGEGLQFFKMDNNNTITLVSIIGICCVSFLTEKSKLLKIRHVLMFL